MVMVDEKFLSFLSVLPSVAPAQQEEDADKEASSRKKPWQRREIDEKQEKKLW